MTQPIDPRPPRDPRMQQVLDRATTDPHFRQQLLTAPHAAIRDTFGVTIPLTFRIKFIEREPDVDALVVLPAAARQAGGQDGELDDSDLDSVAGGFADASADDWTRDAGWGGSSAWDG